MFFAELRTAPEFASLANARLWQAAIVSGSAGVGAFVGFCVAGPIGAMLGGGLATYGGIKASHANQSDRTLLQLITALNAKEQAELWLQVSLSLSSIAGGEILTVAVLRANAGPVIDLINAFMNKRHAPPGGA